MHNTVSGGRALPKTNEDNQQPSGRCHYCGYSLTGLEKRGNCPECGTEYTEETASRLKPWPGAFDICLRLGLPLVLLALLSFWLIPSIAIGDFRFTMILVVVASIFYILLGSMLRKYLPELKCKLGFIPRVLTIATVVVGVLTFLIVLLIWWVLDWYFWG